LTHATESGLEIKIVNNSEYPFDGSVRVQVRQGGSSVTKSVELEMDAFGVVSADLGGEWAAGSEADPFNLVLDPQGELDDPDLDNNQTAFLCPLPDAPCQIQ